MTEMTHEPVKPTGLCQECAAKIEIIGRVRRVYCYHNQAGAVMIEGGKGYWSIYQPISENEFRNATELALLIDGAPLQH